MDKDSKIDRDGQLVRQTDIMKVQFRKLGASISQAKELMCKSKVS